LPSLPALAKAPQPSEFKPMIAIAAIVAFLVVIAALNLYEFGRLD
jgi:hypothetical protein